MKLGIDIGSTTIKAVLLNDDNSIICKPYTRHRLEIKQKLLELLYNIKHQINFDVPVKMAFSGSAAMGIVKDLDLPFVQEVYASKVCTEHFNKGANTVIELGGEDAKILFLDPPLEVKMNGTCAGGTGSFIDQIATLLNIPIEEINEIASKHTKTYPIASRCGVFAKTDVQALLNQGASREDILKSVFNSVAVQTVTGLTGGREITGKVLYLGGPLTFFSELRNSFNCLLNTTGICPEGSLHYVAIGAALEAKQDFCLSSLLKKIECSHFKSENKSNEPLFKNNREYQTFLHRHKKHRINLYENILNYEGKTFLGIDAGSTTLKVVLINDSDDIIFQKYIKNEGDPVGLVKKILTEIYKKNKNINIVASASTGYGEELIKNAFNLDFGIVETIAHLTAAKKFLKDVNFIVDIGGQDIKCFKIGDNGAIEDIFLNEACSSGCGSFLQSFANILGYSVSDFSNLGLFSKNPVDLGSRCTVFMNSAVKQAQKDGAKLEDISAGLSISVVKNALYKVIRINGADDLGKNIVVQGGTFLNDAVLRAFEKELKTEVIRPNISGLMGAYGAALYAKKSSKSSNLNKSRIIDSDKILNFFRKTTTVNCGGCTNNCELTISTFASGQKYISGNRCEKPIVFKRENCLEGVDLYEYKLQILKEYMKKSLKKEDVESQQEKIVGIPLVLNMYELLPFWYKFFETLGFKVIVSPISNKVTYSLGQSTIPSDTVCYPAKLVHGHVAQLLNMGIKNIFYPCMSYNLNEKTGDNHYNCPIVAYYPEVIKANIKDLERVNFINDYVGLHRKYDFTKKIFNILCKYFKNVKFTNVITAVYNAYKEYEKYKKKIKSKGNEILNLAQKYSKPVILLAGRPYHIDPQINHNINKLITSLGAFVITEDAVNYNDVCSENLAVLNQWTYQSRIYKAAEFVVNRENVNLVQLISFGCGTDSIVSDEVKRILTNGKKIYTGIKIDENSNLGAIKIRLRSLKETVLGKSDT